MIAESYYSKKKATFFISPVVLIILAGLYLLNCASPLRLHVDTLRYFAIKDCIESGCPPDSVAAKDYLPYGYTVLLLILSKLGILKSFVIIFINCIYLFSSLLLVRKIVPAYYSFFLVAGGVLLNWTVIKFATHPLSEMQYLFLSVASIYFFYQYTLNKKILLLVWAVIFGVLAFFTRTVGVTLFAALLCGFLWQYKEQVTSLIKRNRLFIIVILLIVAGVFIFSKQLGLNHYTGVLSKQFDEGAKFSKILGWHFTEWAEIAFNISIARVQAFYPGSFVHNLFLTMGILSFAGAVYLVFIRKNNIPFIIKAYLFFYTLLMFNWPFYDPRFWVPVIPFYFAAFSIVISEKRSFPKLFFIIYAVIYSILGISAVSYMTYTSLNREVMAKKQANGVYRNEYETHFFGHPLSDTAKKTDPVILEVLRKHN